MPGRGGWFTSDENDDRPSDFHRDADKGVFAAG
jgi:hypothetical protein